MLFRSGWPLGCYNFFPSNIAGLPCLYTIRLNSEGWRAFEPDFDILVSLNPKTLPQNLKSLKPGGALLTDEKDQAASAAALREAFGAGGGPAAAGGKPPAGEAKASLRGGAPASQSGKRPLCHIALPFTKSLIGLTGLSPKLRLLLRNILYAGLLAEWLQIEESLAQKSIEGFFGAGAGGGKSEAGALKASRFQASDMGGGQSGGRGPEGKTAPPAGAPQAGLSSESRSQIIEQNLKAFEMGRALGRQNPLPPSIPLPKKPLFFKGEEATGHLTGGGSQQHAGFSKKRGALLVQTLVQTLAQSLAQSRSGSRGQGPAAAEDKAGQATEKSSRPAASPEIFIDGNTAAALGALASGCQLLSWYPITPATSFAESFEKFAGACQKDGMGKAKYAVIQAEDEIAALGHVIGAGWAGIRAMTVTSGPGLSLMSEGAGLAYFSETPAVLCNVQRAGPSTGLPTRTQQGDLLSACFLSHGGCEHIVLLPGTPEECFAFSQKAFDLAEELQTLVIVLSDLDLGMNLRPSAVFRPGPGPLKRGKTLKAADLDSGRFARFARYADPDGDGVSRRLLPGERHEKAGYLIRGSGHNEKAEYSEAPRDYAGKLDKLKRKAAAAKKMMPEPVMSFAKESPSSAAFVTFGGNEEAVRELMAVLKKERGLSFGFMRLRSFPFPASAEKFLKGHSDIFVVEQNRDGQLRKLLSGEFPAEAHKMKSILQYDGRPLFVRHIKEMFFQSAGGLL